jgi:HD-GYP domain-containing protein (c-di-GMP phosphodiesterase class II)
LSFSLPNNLFTSHRLVEDGEMTFRLSDKYRTQLLRGNDAPLPTHLPGEDEPVLRSVQALSGNLTGVLGHFIRLDDTPALIEHLAGRIRALAARSPDGCIAAILLCSYQHYTPRHAVNCALLAARMAHALRLTEAETGTLITAALTMNLGSMDVQNQLSSQEGSPSTLQRQILDIHPIMSSAMLREVGIESAALHTTVIMHHERKDGRGYTFGATEPSIPRHAHLIHLIDIITAKLMPRAYRVGIPAKSALASLYSGPTEPFDAQFIAQIVRILGLYPPGSFVELENGERALVTGSGATAATPTVAPLRAPKTAIDTSEPGYHVKSAVYMRVDPRHLPLLDSYWR